MRKQSITLSQKDSLEIHDLEYDPQRDDFMQQKKEQEH